MSSIVLELQQELLNKDCDILQALRKAHVIATKLQLREFDEWIQNELNGYKGENERFPDYRQMKGTLKARNPYLGWIPAAVTTQNNRQPFNSVPVFESISALLDIEKKSKDGYFYYSYPPELSMKINKSANTPTYMEIALFINTVHITEVVDKVRNCLLEWTLQLEQKGILGEKMTFSTSESVSAKEVPQQINYYYGSVINGDVSDSQIVSGNSNTNTYNISHVNEMLQEIREKLHKENLSDDDMGTMLEILDDISEKVERSKKLGVIKFALLGLKDFALAVGADVTAAFIIAKMKGIF